MRVRKFLILFLTILFVTSFFANASNIRQNKNKFNMTNIDYAELPTWNIGNYWKYDMDFIFIARDSSGSSTKFSVDAVVDDLYAVLTDIDTDEGKEIYVLSVDGTIEGTLSLFNAEIDVADFRGDFGGYAHMGKTTLGIKKFIFTVDGEANVPLLGWKDLYFEMTLDFNENFDFFNFPINSNEGSWDVHIDNASLVAEVDIDVPFGEQDFSDSMVFNDLIKVKCSDTVTVPAGTYDAIKIGGNWGHVSDLWYAPDAGYLVKLDEAILWEGGEIESVFHLNLVETNFDLSNEPPNSPDKPSGETDCLIEQDYTYSASATDPDQDQLYYMFDWGDGTTSSWIGPYPSGSQAQASHLWYNKGMFNVAVKAKDVSGIESPWSEPLPIQIKGDPKITFTIYKIKQIDDIDVGSEPELYYEIAALSEEISSPAQTNKNKEDGEWVSSKTWEPNKAHIFTGYSRYVTVTIKLMDYDGAWELGSDDLADISGCIGDGKDNDVTFKRGAIYHGTYDLVEKQLKAYGTGEADENADYVYKQNGYYITSGLNQPDNSEGSDKNDAEVWFQLTNDYKPPQAKIQLVEENDVIKPGAPIQLAGAVQDGKPDYSWHWGFGDGTTSSVQNPIHTFSSSGSFKVTLTVTDGFEQTSSYSVNIDIENTNPILSNDKVEWTGSGNVNDMFTFTVHYIDSDGDEPIVKNVVIDGKSQTLQGSGSNSDYSLALVGSAIGKGSHTYHFYFEDGFGGSDKTNSKTFSVSKTKSVSKSNLDIFFRFRVLLPFFSKILHQIQ